jgi:hypothetical protein
MSRTCLPPPHTLRPHTPHPHTDTHAAHTLSLSHRHFSWRRIAKGCSRDEGTGGEVVVGLGQRRWRRRRRRRRDTARAQTRRQRPLTDLTPPVIGVLPCQHVNQIKMNGASPRPLEARLIGPNFISPSNCSYRKINRASEQRRPAQEGGNTRAYK